MTDKKVRVRFAPSPTGPLHMGGVRTALFNYLFAKQNGGDFLLRIEDTDQTRYVQGAEEYIQEALKWCGLKVDEGPRNEGEYGPYRQSERKKLYRDYADKLIRSGDAYLAFDKPEELDFSRKEYEERGETFTYNSETRLSMRNSLALTDDETQELIDNGEPYVVRFKMPDNIDVTINDIIRGEVTFNTDRLDDKVIYKSDGMPTYHLANVVDDHLMKISHVIRGEEWLPSLPLHALLYEKLGWERPDFAHLPLILKPVGKGKLSKRDGDKMGFPVFPLMWTDPKTGSVSSGYREDGYLPDAFINMLALLGWNPGDDRELFSMEELINIFSLNRVGKAGARFDPEKAKWFNHQFIQMKSDEDLAEKFHVFLVEKGIESEMEYIVKVVGMLKERANFIADIWDQGYYFFQSPQQYDAKAVKKRWKDGVPEKMQEIHGFLDQYKGEWEAVAVKNAFSEFVNGKEWGFGVIMNAFRLCIVGALMGADLFEICEMIGKEETLVRIQNGIEKIQR